MKLLDEPAVDAAIERLADSLYAAYEPLSEQPPAVVGIHTGGFWVAERLHTRLGERMSLAGEIGGLDISFYRDDFSRIGVHPRVRPSRLPFEIEQREVLLVDDVLFTGRTVRAALNEIFDYGRPSRVRLAVLVERGGRELPVCADAVGERLSPQPGEQIKLYGPETLELHSETV